MFDETAISSGTCHVVMLGFEIRDGEPSDVDRMDGIEDVPYVNHVVVERHRGGLQLERAARLVSAAYRAVEPLVRRRWPRSAVS